LEKQKYCDIDPSSLENNCAERLNCLMFSCSFVRFFIVVFLDGFLWTYGFLPVGFLGVSTFGRN
jgi:hypothetical protein